MKKEEQIQCPYCKSIGSSLSLGFANNHFQFCKEKGKEEQMTAKKNVEEAILDMNKILNAYNIKPARQLTILRMADIYANAKTLHIAEQAVGEVRKKYARGFDHDLLNKTISRIKTLIEE